MGRGLPELAKGATQFEALDQRKTGRNLNACAVPDFLSH